MRRDSDISGAIDWTTVTLFLGLVTFGWLNILAAVYDEGSKQALCDLSMNPARQLLFIGAAIVIAFAITIIDLRFYETFAYVFYGVILFALLLVPIIGKEVGGNKAWLGIGSFGVQPSEFAKFVTALAIAKFIGSVGFRMDNLRNQIILLIMIGVPMALILLQKDTGTALVFTVFVLVFFREGMSPFLIIVGVAAAFIFILTLLVEQQVYLYISIGIILIVTILAGKRKVKRIALLTIGALVIIGMMESVDYVISDVLKPHQQNRVKALVNPDADPLGFG